MPGIHLLGRVILRGDIKLVTGLHIGGGAAGLQIGGLDNPVVRDPVTRQPYIPGSSLKGKMRSLAERQRGFDPENRNETQRIGQVRIHVCQTAEAYATCPVCPLFGLPGELEHSTPTRLTVRDVRLDPASLTGADLDFISTEVKWEASIDRVTSAALPRQIERVPAAALFPNFEIVCSLYDLGQGRDRELGHLRTLFNSMQLLEDDYLGGMGSRGNGKIEFTRLSLEFRHNGATDTFDALQGGNLAGLIGQQDAVIQWVQSKLGA